MIKISREALKWPTLDGWTVQELSQKPEIGKILLKYQNSMPKLTTPSPAQTSSNILRVSHPARMTIILGTYVYRYVSCFQIHAVETLMIDMGDKDQGKACSQKPIDAISKIYKYALKSQYPMHRSKKVDAQDLSTFVRSVSKAEFHKIFVISSKK